MIVLRVKGTRSNGSPEGSAMTLVRGEGLSRTAAALGLAQSVLGCCQSAVAATATSTNAATMIATRM